MGTIYIKNKVMILLDMVNVIFLFLAEALEVVSVILSLPARLIGDISSFFYGCSRALDNNGNNDDIDNE